LSFESHFVVNLAEKEARMMITNLMTIKNVGIFFCICAVLMLVYMARCSYYLNKCLKELERLNAVLLDEIMKVG
jgi:hypothetical protein